MVRDVEYMLIARHEREVIVMAESGLEEYLKAHYLAGERLSGGYAL
ncbi:MAG: hypothetical protein NT045_01850 [Candidatus Aureabacteria bacterium]|nr:hypothetical protein [Candidatus Auribacterota bacterium]